MYQPVAPTVGTIAMAGARLVQAKAWRKRHEHARRYNARSWGSLPSSAATMNRVRQCNYRHVSTPTSVVPLTTANPNSPPRDTARTGHRLATDRGPAASVTQRTASWLRAAGSIPASIPNVPTVRICDLHSRSGRGLLPVKTSRGSTMLSCPCQPLYFGTSSFHRSTFHQLMPSRILSSGFFLV